MKTLLAIGLAFLALGALAPRAADAGGFGIRFSFCHGHRHYRSHHGHYGRYQDRPYPRYRYRYRYRAYRYHAYSYPRYRYRDRDYVYYDDYPRSYGYHGCR